MATVPTSLSVDFGRPGLSHQPSATENCSSNHTTTGTTTTTVAGPASVIRGPLIRRQESLVEEIEKRQRESLSQKLKDHRLALPASSSRSAANLRDMPTIAGGPSLRLYMQRRNSGTLYQSPSTSGLPTFSTSRTSGSRPPLSSTRHSVSGYPLRYSQSLTFLNEETAGADVVESMRDGVQTEMNGALGKVQWNFFAKSENESPNHHEPERIPFTWTTDNRSSTARNCRTKIDETSEDTFDDLGGASTLTSARRPPSLPMCLSSPHPVVASKNIDVFPDEGFVSQLSMSSDETKAGSLKNGTSSSSPCDDNVFSDEDLLSRPSEEENLSIKERSTPENNKLLATLETMALNSDLGDSHLGNHQQTTDNRSYTGTTSKTPVPSAPSAEEVTIKSKSVRNISLETSNSHKDDDWSVRKTEGRVLGQAGENQIMSTAELRSATSTNVPDYDPVTCQASQVPIELQRTCKVEDSQKNSNDVSLTTEKCLLLQPLEVDVNTTTTATLSVKASTNKIPSSNRENNNPDTTDAISSTLSGFSNGYSGADNFKNENGKLTEEQSLPNSQPQSSLPNKTSRADSAGETIRNLEVHQDSRNFNHTSTANCDVKEKSTIMTENGISKETIYKKVNEDTSTGLISSTATNGSTGTLMELEWDKGPIGLGFCIEGGRDCPLGDLPITVKRLFKGETSAQKILQAGDELVTVNETSLVGVNHFRAWNILKAIPSGPVRMTIRRKDPVSQTC